MSGDRVSLRRPWAVRRPRPAGDCRATEPAFLYGGARLRLPIADRFRVQRVAMGPNTDLRCRTGEAAVSERLNVIVAGLIGQYPIGGVTWDYIQYVLGLRGARAQRDVPGRFGSVALQPERERQRAGSCLQRRAISST